MAYPPSNNINFSFLKEDLNSYFHPFNLSSEPLKKSNKKSHPPCTNCEAKSTAVWRRGPWDKTGDARSLCNRCGLVWSKLIKKNLPELEERSDQVKAKIKAGKPGGEIRILNLIEIAIGMIKSPKNPILTINLEEEDEIRTIFSLVEPSMEEKIYSRNLLLNPIQVNKFNVS